LTLLDGCLQESMDPTHGELCGEDERMSENWNFRVDTTWDVSTCG
jgi:hypothetical protein